MSWTKFCSVSFSHFAWEHQNVLFQKIDLDVSCVLQHDQDSDRLQSEFQIQYFSKQNDSLLCRICWCCWSYHVQVNASLSDAEKIWGWWSWFQSPVSVWSIAQVSDHVETLVELSKWCVVNCCFVLKIYIEIKWPTSMNVNVTWSETFHKCNEPENFVMSLKEA